MGSLELGAGSAVYQCVCVFRFRFLFRCMISLRTSWTSYDIGHVLCSSFVGLLSDSERVVFYWYLWRDVAFLLVAVVDPIFVSIGLAITKYQTLVMGGCTIPMSGSWGLNVRLRGGTLPLGRLEQSRRGSRRNILTMYIRFGGTWVGRYQSHDGVRFSGAQSRAYRHQTLRDHACLKSIST